MPLVPHFAHITSPPHPFLGQILNYFCVDDSRMHGIRLDFPIGSVKHSLPLLSHNHLTQLGVHVRFDGIVIATKRETQDSYISTDIVLFHTDLL